MHDERWQVQRQYWQDQFIADNAAELNFYGWKGFLEIGRGVVVCQVHSGLQQIWNAIVNFQTIVEVEHYLQKYASDSQLMDYLQTAIAFYVPSLEIILLLDLNDHVELIRFRYSLMPPWECYDQICKRWSEFQLEPCDVLSSDYSDTRRCD